ncbi:hypothetical protein H0W26_04635, partial [Candidatus Dependentiae bacterium]|nr:hypothetical protein [Candidatus Dependentiae bacterium]
MNINCISKSYCVALLGITLTSVYIQSMETSIDKPSDKSAADTATPPTLFNGGEKLTSSTDLLSSNEKNEDKLLKEDRLFTIMSNLSTCSLKSLAFSPNGKTLLTLGTRGTAHLWDVQTGEQLLELKSTDGIRFAAFSINGKTILAESWGVIRFHDAKTGVALKKITGRGRVTSAVMSDQSETLLLSLQGSSKAHIYDLTTNKELFVFEGHTGEVTSVALSTDEEMVITGSSDGTARLWSTTKRERFLACSPTRNLLFEGKGGIHAVLLGELNGHTAPVTSVAFSNDGKTVLTGSKDKTARLWDTATGK